MYIWRLRLTPRPGKRRLRSGGMARKRGKYLPFDGWAYPLPEIGRTQRYFCCGKYKPRRFPAYRRSF